MAKSNARTNKKATTKRTATPRPTATRPDPAARNEPAKRKPAGRTGATSGMNDDPRQATESGEPRRTGKSSTRR